MLAPAPTTAASAYILVNSLVLPPSLHLLPPFPTLGTPLLVPRITPVPLTDGTLNPAVSLDTIAAAAARLIAAVNVIATAGASLNTNTGAASYIGATSTHVAARLVAAAAPAVSASSTVDPAANSDDTVNRLAAASAVARTLPAVAPVSTGAPAAKTGASAGTGSPAAKTVAPASMVAHASTVAAASTAATANKGTPAVNTVAVRSSGASTATSDGLTPPGAATTNTLAAANTASPDAKAVVAVSTVAPATNTVAAASTDAAANMVTVVSTDASAKTVTTCETVCVATNRVSAARAVDAFERPPSVSSTGARVAAAANPNAGGDATLYAYISAKKFYITAMAASRMAVNLGLPVVEVGLMHDASRPAKRQRQGACAVSVGAPARDFVGSCASTDAGGDNSSRLMTGLNLPTRVTPFCGRWWWRCTGSVLQLRRTC